MCIDGGTTCILMFLASLMDNHESTPQEPPVSADLAVVSPEDLDTLHRKHFLDIASYIGSIVNNRDEAQDLAQDTFVNAFTALIGNNHPHGEKPIWKKGVLHWLLRIAHNEAVDYSRRQNRIQTEPIDGYTDHEQQIGYMHSDWENLQSALTDRGDVEAIVDRKTTLQNIFNSLPPKMSQALYLACVKGYSYAEIAAKMELQENTVRKLIHRARRKLERL